MESSTTINFELTDIQRDAKRILKEVNKLLKEYDIPSVMGIYVDDKMHYEVTLPVEVGITDEAVEKKFNKFLRDCTDF